MSGVRMSVLYQEEDYEPGNTFRHPVEHCSACDRLVIGSSARGYILCEECYELYLGHRRLRHEPHATGLPAEANHVAAGVPTLRPATSFVCGVRCEDGNAPAGHGDVPGL